MSEALQSGERPLFRPLYLSEMSVLSDTNNIVVSPTMSMTACIFTLIAIFNILYMIYEKTDAVQLLRPE